MEISASGLRQRQDALLVALASDGQVEANELDLSLSPAALDFRIRAPGGQAGHVVSFRYFEKYVPNGANWLMSEYVFLLAWPNGIGQFEYHWHPFRWSGGEAIFHIHCQPPRGDRGHFRGHRLLLEEARADLLRRYASGMPVECGGLYALDTV